MYKIIGAGTEENPITIEVDGRESSIPISWIVRTVEDFECSTDYVDTSYGTDIMLGPLSCGDETKETEGTYVLRLTETETITVYYVITQKGYDCEDENTCECDCDVIRSWTSPYYISDDYDGDIDFYCEYWLITSDCSKEKRMFHTTITKDDLGNQIVIEDGCGTGCTVTPKCDIEIPKECTCYCEVIRSWTDPYFITDIYEGDIEFYCKYFLISKTSNGELCNMEEKLWHITIKKDDLGKEFTVEDCDAGCTVTPKCIIEETCDCDSVEINVTLKPVPPTPPPPPPPPPPPTQCDCNDVTIVVD